MFFMVFVNFLEITVFYVRAGLFLMPVLIACSLLMSCPWSWHWPSCLWQEVPRRACLIRRKGSLLGLVTLQRPMVMSPMLSVCKCVLVQTYCTGQCGSCWLGWGGGGICVHTHTCFLLLVYVCMCVYLWGEDHWPSSLLLDRVSKLDNQHQLFTDRRWSHSVR